ncbi:MAG: hypothetical protein Q8N80_03575 [Candidatus Omnitrophota bacterium]|nr:hypothetical protein [Candidatus Omnitrophota bacterium]
MNIKWDNKLSYCVGLLASDGNLSKDGRHIVFVSKDIDLIKTFKICLGLKNKIAIKNSGYNKNGKYYYIQFGNVKLYRWLNNIGITANKSKTIGTLKIPNKYFFDFLRGLLDGDGCVTSFKHLESKHPQIRVKFCSASKDFLIWLKSKIYNLLSLSGKIGTIPRVFELIYYKHSSIKLLKRIYNKSTVFLNRKFEKTRILLGSETGGWCNWQTREA